MKVHQHYKKKSKGKTSTEIFPSPVKYSWSEASHQLWKKSRLTGSAQNLILQWKSSKGIYWYPTEFSELPVCLSSALNYIFRCMSTLPYVYRKRCIYSTKIILNKHMFVSIYAYSFAQSGNSRIKLCHFQTLIKFSSNLSPVQVYNILGQSIKLPQFPSHKSWDLVWTFSKW